MISAPEVGQLVVVRKRPFVVLEVIPSIPGQSGELRTPTHLVRLSSVEDDGLGEELQVIWEIEPGTSVHEQSTLPEPTTFDAPLRLQAFLDAVRWGAVSQADDKALQSPFRSGIEIEEYQLDPVVRALSMPRVNLLIADDVGLGKTIEAGLVVQELILRHRVRSVLVVCPSSLQLQWKEEMRDKFGLEFRIIDSESIGELRRKRGIHVNPWRHFPRLITSIDYIKRERPLRSFHETLPAGDEPTYPRAYDLLIVDEAHNVAPSGRGRYATDSQRTTAIRSLARHFEHKLFLSATPHNGYRESFIALLELLDAQRFARTVEPVRAQLDAVMVRRMKSELKANWDGTPRFPERKVTHLEVPYTETEREVHRLLQEYSTKRLNRAKENGDSIATEFVLKLLKKRLFSSPAAFQTTLDKHIANIGSRKGAGTIMRAIEDYGDDYADDEVYEDETRDVMSIASGGMNEPTQEERVLLERLHTLADKAAQRADSKAHTLIDWLNATLRPDGPWNNERVIIFTEYRATQKWLHDILARHGFASGQRMSLIYGGMPNDDRETVKAAFQAHPSAAPVRILLTTDAASEGVNLQNHCSRLIHFEIPWNPNRMEQRNGRVDRHGQRAPEVRIFHFVGKGFDATASHTRIGDLDADLEFLMRAALKVETIREDLGKVGPVIAAQVEEAMLGKRSALNTSRAEDEAAPVRRMLRFERELRQQLERLARQLHDTRDELHLTPDHIENVVRVGLELAGQPALIPAQVDGLWPDPRGRRRSCPVFHLPALANSWAQCLDGLAHPHTHKIRPVVFDAALATGRDDVVLAHLNHRLVQMCLRLLRAEIWSLGNRPKHLARVSACVATDDALREPVVLAHGRIVVLGGDNHRLHEEIITAGGALDGGRFRRLKVGEVEAAMAAVGREPVPEATAGTLRELWPRHREALREALKAREKERTRSLGATLDARCEQEVDKITAIMTELKAAIETELAKKDDPQFILDLTFDEPGRVQRESDFAALRRRVKEIPDEIRHEAEHIRSRFATPLSRLFPVAITYILPRRLVQTTGGGR